MTKKILPLILAIAYLLCFLAGLILVFRSAAGFALASPYFWACTVLPLLVLLAHLAAAVLLFRDWRRAAPAVVAVELLAFLAVILGLALFFDTFKWLALLAVPRACIAAVIIYYLWAPFAERRALLLAGAAAGLVLGLLLPLLLRPPAEGAKPAIAPGQVVRVYDRGSAPTDNGSSWLNGFGLPTGQLIFRPDARPTLTFRSADSLLALSPIGGLQQISTDGFWTTFLNTVGMRIMGGGAGTFWTDGPAKFASYRYDSAERVKSRFAADAVQKRFPDEILSADLYLKADTRSGDIDLVSLMRLRRPVFVHQSSLFDMVFQRYTGQGILLPGLGRLDFAKSSPAGLDRTHRIVSIQGPDAVLYRTGPDSAAPFQELARSPQFPGAVVLEDFAPGRGLLIYFPDWRSQALQQPAPSAAPLAANDLDLGLQMGPQSPAPDTAFVEQLHVHASVADASFGPGRAVVPLKEGAYLNRVALRLVPKQDDYLPLIRAMQLWTPPAAK